MVEKVKDRTYYNRLIAMIFENRWNRLSIVQRYQAMPMNNRLSVADHSWTVAMLSMLIFDEVVKENESQDYVIDGLFARLMRKALLHDLEECVTGDIPLHHMIVDSAKEFKQEVGPSIIVYALNHNTLKYKEIWEESKLGWDGWIVKYADMLSALLEAVNEYKSGNTFMTEVLSLAPELLEKIVKDGYMIKVGDVDYTDLNYDARIFLDKLTKSIYKYVDDLVGVV